MRNDFVCHGCGDIIDVIMEVHWTSGGFVCQECWEKGDDE